MAKLSAKTASALMGGYTAAELEAAFNLVAPKENWKLPIRAELPLYADRALIGFAITFYTGSVAHWHHASNGWIVNAEGYYGAVGP